MASEPGGSPGVPAALEYARGVHAEALASNRDLYTRAQIALTLDGIVLGATGAALATDPLDLRATIDGFAATTWALLALAGGALIASVLCSTLALGSKHRQSRAPASDPYDPVNTWYYARIATLDRDRFVARASQATTDDEIRARLTQVAIMGPIMVRRAGWLNRAFAGTGAAFVFFALAGGDYLIRLG